MERIIESTKYLPNKSIIYLIFNDLLILHNNELYFLNKNNFNINYINTILIKTKHIGDSTEKYYRIKNYFNMFLLNLFKNLSNIDKILIYIHGNTIIPKNSYSVENIKKSINIICNRKYKYNVFICFFSNIIYVGANRLDVFESILLRIRINRYNKVINNMYLNNNDFKIIYKKLWCL